LATLASCNTLSTPTMDPPPRFSSPLGRRTVCNCTHSLSRAGCKRLLSGHFFCLFFWFAPLGVLPLIVVFAAPPTFLFSVMSSALRLSDLFTASYCGTNTCRSALTAFRVGLLAPDTITDGIYRHSAPLRVFLSYDSLSVLNLTYFVRRSSRSSVESSHFKPGSRALHQGNVCR